MIIPARSCFENETQFTRSRSHRRRIFTKIRRIFNQHFSSRSNAGDMDLDLSVIEIDGEDDSLLQPIPALGETTNRNSVDANSFSCSPLNAAFLYPDKRRGSPIRVFKDTVDMENLTFSSPRGSYNKENRNMNKSEQPKLNMEPRKMKRKKFGGYNLRKSLAWDRAFFTEEGVLDSLELSMLSGSCSKSSGDALSVISETEGNTSDDDSECNTDSADQQACEKERLNDSSGCLLQKDNSSAPDNIATSTVATGKGLSVLNRGKSGSKAGFCPRPPTSSSLKRPANFGSVKAAAKESKLPKKPVLKTSLCSLPATNKSTMTSVSKHNQIAQPVSTLQKNTGLKSSVKDGKCTQSKTKISPLCMPLPAKPLAQHSRSSRATLPLEVHSLTDRQPTVVQNIHNVSKEIRDSIVSSIGVPSSDVKDGSTSDVSLIPNRSATAGNAQYAPAQTMKPSGLRMPSPSLGFFGQPKASVSRSVSQRDSQLNNIPEPRIPGLQNMGRLRPPIAPRKMPKMASDTTASVNTALSSIEECCNRTKEYSESSAHCPVPDETMKFEGDVNNLRNVDMEVPYDLIRPEPIVDKSKMHNIVGFDEEVLAGVKHDNDEMMCKEDMEVRLNEDQLFIENESFKQLGDGNNLEKATFVPGSEDYDKNNLENSQSVCQRDKGFSGTKGMVENQQEDKLLEFSVINDGVISELPFGDSISLGGQPYSSVQDHGVAVIHNFDAFTTTETHIEVHCLKTNDITNNRSLESNICENGGTVSVSFRATEYSGGMGSAHVLGQHEFRELELRPENEIVNLTNEPHLEDSESLTRNEEVCGKICSNDLRTLAANQHLKVDGSSEQFGEILDSQDPRRSLDNDILFGKSTCSEEEQGEQVIRSDLCVGPSTSEYYDSTVLITSITDEIGDGGLHVEERVDQPPVGETPLDLLQSALSVENLEFSIDSHCGHESNLTLEFVAPLNVELGAQISSNGSSIGSVLKEGLMNDVRVEGAKLRNSVVISYEESDDYEEHQKYLIEGISNNTLIVQHSTCNEFPSSLGACQAVSNEHENECARGGDNKTNRTMDDRMLSLTGNLITPTKQEQFVNTKNHNAESNEQQNLPKSCPSIQHDMRNKHAPSLGDSLLPGKDTNSVDLMLDNALTSVAEIARKGDDCSPESKSCSVVALFPATVEDTDIDVDDTCDNLHMEAILGPSVGVHMDIANQVSKSCPEFRSSSKELGLSVRQDDTISAEISQICNDFDGQERNILEDETNIVVTERSLVGEISHAFDRDRCFVNDSSTATQISDKISEIVEKGESVRIKPPVNADPFSDEWLAAIEAAGEEILTMKGGAVQNSPPDKSIPEPGPWSPVKRKTNQVGPFDCTKFNKVLPSDS